MTRVAIFTDNDCRKANGLSTTLNAVRRFIPSDICVRVYTAADCESIGEDYRSVSSIGIDLPWQRKTRVYWPRMRRFSRALAADHIDVLHLTTPGPVGFAGRWLSRRVARPLTGSCHSLADLAH